MRYWEAFKYNDYWTTGPHEIILPPEDEEQLSPGAIIFHGWRLHLHNLAIPLQAKAFSPTGSSGAENK